jgi:hypothetical protein
MNSGPGHIQWTYSSTYSGFNIQQNVAPLLLEICRQFTERYTANLVPIQRITSNLRNVNCGPRHVQCIYSSANSGFIIQLNVCAQLFEIYRKFNVRYSAKMVPNTAHILHFTQCGLLSRTYAMYLQLYIFRLQYSSERICAAIGDMSTIQPALYCKFGANTAHILQFTQCELWSRTCTMYLQLRIFRLQYSTERICAGIGDISTTKCALYCNHGAKYSVHLPVYSMWTVVPAIYSVITPPRIQSSIFNKS